MLDVYEGMNGWMNTKNKWVSDVDDELRLGDL